MNTRKCCVALVVALFFASCAKTADNAAEEQPADTAAAMAEPSLADLPDLEHALDAGERRGHEPDHLSDSSHGRSLDTAASRPRSVSMIDLADRQRRRLAWLPRFARALPASTAAAIANYFALS